MQCRQYRPDSTRRSERIQCTHAFPLHKEERQIAVRNHLAAGQQLQHALRGAHAHELIVESNRRKGRIGHCTDIIAAEARHGDFIRHRDALLMQIAQYPQADVIRRTDHGRRRSGQDLIPLGIGQHEIKARFNELHRSARIVLLESLDKTLPPVLPHGLIRYTTQHALDGQAVHVLRPRIFVYATLLTALVAAWTWGVFNRSPLIADVLRDRNALYQQRDDRVSNGYTLKLVNKSEAPHRYSVTLASDGKVPYTLSGSPLLVQVPAGAVVSQEVEIEAPAKAVKGRQDLRFVIEADDGSAKANVDSTFFGPM